MSKLSYWTDNKAGYSFWGAPVNVTQWGNPEDIFVALKAGYERAACRSARGRRTSR